MGYYDKVSAPEEFTVENLRAAALKRRAEYEANLIRDIEDKIRETAKKGGMSYTYTNHTIVIENNVNAVLEHFKKLGFAASSHKTIEPKWSINDNTYITITWGLDHD